jgi:hypothetical protein
VSAASFLILGFAAGLVVAAIRFEVGEYQHRRRAVRPRKPTTPPSGEAPKPPPGGMPLNLRGTVPPPPYIVHLYPRGHVFNLHGWEP